MINFLRRLAYVIVGLFFWILATTCFIILLFIISPIRWLFIGEWGLVDRYMNWTDKIQQDFLYKIIKGTQKNEE